MTALFHSSNRAHLGIAHPANFRDLRYTSILATLTPVLDLASHFQRSTGGQPGRRSPVTPDRFEGASGGDAIGRTGSRFIQLDLSAVDHKSGVAVDDLDLVTLVLCFETKSPEEISSLGWLINANARVG